MLEGARLVFRVMLYSMDSSLAGSPTLRIHPPLSRQTLIALKHASTGLAMQVRMREGSHMTVLKPLTQGHIGAEHTGRCLSSIMCERSVQRVILPIRSSQDCSLVVDWHTKGQVPDVHMVEQL